MIHGRQPMWIYSNVYIQLSIELTLLVATESVDVLGLLLLYRMN